MTAIVEVSKTVTAVGGAVAAPNPYTILMASKQLWEDYKRASGAFKNYQKNKAARLAK